MSKFASLLGGNAALVGGGAVVIGVAVFASGVFKQPDPVEPPKPEPAVAVAPSAPEPKPEPEVAPEPEAEASTASAPETPTETTEATALEDAVAATEEATAETETVPAKAEEATAPIIPAFDVVRVDGEGNTVIAGRAAPGALIAVLLDGAEIARTVADTAGKFASLLVIDPSPQPRVLTLVERRDEGDLVSDASFIIAPVIPAPVVVAEAAPSPSPETPEAPAVPVVADTAPVTPPEASEGAETELAETESKDASQPAENVEEAVAEAVQDAVEAVETQVAEVQPEPQPEATASPADAAQADPAPTSEADPVDTVASDPQQTPAPTEPASTETAAAETAPAAPATPTETAETDPAPAPKKAPAVLVSDAEGVRVVQPAAPADTAPEVMSSVAIDAITYSETGAVEIAGRGRKSGFVRIYLDNRPVTGSRISDEGMWRAELPDVDTGVYTLRVDELDDAGKVTSRVETPFKREAPARVAAAQETPEPAPETPPIQVITVQPGSTLWAIARDTYGEGLMYVRVYEANKDKIRDPDLIYPGQVFTVPD